MPKKPDPGLEAWRRRVAAAEGGEKATEKPLEELSLEELEAKRKSLEWEQTKADIERLVEKKRSREEGIEFGLASNQRRSYAEFVKPRPYYR